MILASPYSINSLLRTAYIVSRPLPSPALCRLVHSSAPRCLPSVGDAKKKPKFSKRSFQPYPSSPDRLPLPSGYTIYPNHNDAPQHISLMSKIYTSAHPDPVLPRSSIYHYLYPPTIKGKYNHPYPPPSPTAPAFIDGLTGRKVTREEVGEQARWLAAGLSTLGLKRGDVACIYGLNSLEWVNAAMGCQALNMIVSPANPGYTPPELLHQLRDSTAKLVFVMPLLLPNLLKTLSLPDAPKIEDRRIILLCRKADKPADAKYKCAEELWQKDTRFKAVQLNQGEETLTAFLCYSSGTTGLAKGVETSHHNMTSQLQALTVAYESLKPGRDVIMGILPLSHIYGLTCVLHQPLTSGVPVVLLPRFDEVAFLSAIQKYKVTFALVVPPVLIVLLHSKNVAKYDISSFRVAMSGAAPLGADLMSAVTKKLKVTVTQGYGMTETSPVINVIRSDQMKPSNTGKVGRLIPTFQARLVDAESGKDVAKGERGEVWVKGPSVMKGYWKNAEATNKTFAEGGWLKTGDVATVDNDGYFSIVDRVKELIKYKGFQVPPAELEALLLTHPRVADAAVIGIYSSSQATELPRAYIVPVGGLGAVPEEKRKEFAEEIINWAAGKVANHKKLRGGVLLMDAIPKSPSGKILRKDLRALAKKEEEEGVKQGRQAKL